MLEKACPQGARSAALARLLKIELYPYQAEGALFAARAGRALIGDEMGLGKTIQAIAAAELLARHFGAERVLVICPTSLKHQWEREIARCTGREAQVIHGVRASRQVQYRDAPLCKITNYETLARDLDLIGAWSPDLVSVDEEEILVRRRAGRRHEGSVPARYAPVEVHGKRRQSHRRDGSSGSARGQGSRGSRRRIRGRSRCR
ncbi:MAG: SNF2-related protein [Burkholderiales bacterium]